MKKLISFLAVFSLILSCGLCGLTTVASAAEASPEADFVVFDGVLEEYLGAGGDIVIPESLGVVEVAAYAFANNNDITSITFCEGIEVIGYRACYQSSNISEVTLPYSLYEIGGTAFSGCGITSVLIPGNCEVIQFGAFGGCPTSEVKFSYGVREIHCSAFNGGLCKTVIFPETVELICGFSFVFPKDSGKMEFIICNPDCEIGYEVQGIKECNDHSWNEQLVSLSYSAINSTQTITYVIPEGSSMRKVIEEDFREHLDSTKTEKTNVSGNKLVVREKPLSYFEGLEENQEGYGVQKPEAGNAGGDGGATVDPNGNSGSTGNGNNTSGNSQNNNQNGSNQTGGNTTYVEKDNSSTWLILGIVGGVVLLIIIGVVVFLVIYLNKPKAAPAPAAAPVPNADDFAKFQAFMAMQNAANAAPAEEASVEEEKTEE